MKQARSLPSWNFPSIEKHILQTKYKSIDKDGWEGNGEGTLVESDPQRASLPRVGRVASLRKQHSDRVTDIDGDPPVGR